MSNYKKAMIEPEDHLINASNVFLLIDFACDGGDRYLTVQSLIAESPCSIPTGLSSSDACRGPQGVGKASVHQPSDRVQTIPRSHSASGGFLPCVPPYIPSQESESELEDPSGAMVITRCVPHNNKLLSIARYWHDIGTTWLPVTPRVWPLDAGPKPLK